VTVSPIRTVHPRSGEACHEGNGDTHCRAARAAESLTVAARHLRDGGMTIVVDDLNPHLEACLTFAAQHASVTTVAFTVRHSSGLLAVAMPPWNVDRLAIPAMPAAHGGRVPYLVSVDAAEGITTGISARDRSHTIRLLSSATTTRSDLVRPGHVLPLRSAAGGTTERPRSPEACIDIMRIAGLAPAAALATLVNDEGSLPSRSNLAAFAEKHRLPVITISEIRAGSALQA
jgi:3,4-dihydroxy-2-butanone 4-phosphate synthase